MSHPSSHGGGYRQDRYVPKSHQKFIPKSKNPNPNPTSLSSSLRQSDSAAGGTGEKGRRPARSGGSFVNYLPQDEAVAAGLGADDGGLDPVESQRVVDLLNRELLRLLKLNSRDFWKEVASDTSLHEFLDSFLQFRSRWYDFPYHGAKGIVAGVIVGELELSRRVFMVLYRISSNRDPGARAADSLSQKDHGAILQDKKLLDLPRLLDICAIYGHENEELTKSLVENAVKAQPWIHDSLSIMLSHFLGIIHTMYRRCSSSLETLLSVGNSEDRGSTRLHADILEVMDFINDGVVSLDAFVSAYKPAAVFLSCPVEMSSGNEELLSTLARLHDSLLPLLQKGLHVMSIEADVEMFSDIVLSLKILSTRILKFGWKLLDFCYLSDDVFKDENPVPAVIKMFPARVEDPFIRADILIQTFRETGGVPENAQEKQIQNRFLQKVERNYQIIDRLRSLQDAGWIFMDDEQFQYLSRIMMHSSKGTSAKKHSHLPAAMANSKELMDEDTAVMQSKISQIKDLFPDYGNGFLAACLEVYNQNPEEVIQRILEGTLHEDLKQLDTSLDRVPPSKSAASSRKDKGKGKLIESTVLPADPYKEQQMKNPLVPPSSSSSTSSAAVGRFVRKSKDDKPDHITLDSRNEQDTAKNAALLSQYEYDDEYDDSFDDLGLTVVESSVEESEIFGDKVASAETEASAAAKWGHRKKPQYYVKDGKNYSYKVPGSVAVANANEAMLVNKAQGELIHGLGRGGNIPLGAVRKLTEYEDQHDNSRPDVSQTEGRENVRNPRERGKGGRGQHKDFHTEQDGPNVSQTEGRENVRNPRGGGRGGRGNHREFYTEQDEDNSNGPEVEGRGNMGGDRGRGRRGGGGRNHYRKDRAMKKHFSGLTGF